MKTCSTPWRATRAHSLDQLVALAGVIDLVFSDPGADADAIAAGAVDLTAPHLVSVGSPDNPGQMGFLALDSHPSDALVGMTAPDEWWALGVVAAGTALPLGADTQVDRSDRRNPGTRVHTVHLVNRDGDAVAVTRLAGAEPVVDRQPRGGDRSLGFLDDCLRRTLGLPTAPAPPSTAGLWAVLWLEALLVAACGGEIDVTEWEPVARCHPLFAFADLPEGEVQEWAVAHLDRAGASFADHHHWGAMLAAEQAGTGLGAVPVDVARWMDEGMYARDLLGALLPLDQAFRDVQLNVRSSISERIYALLHGWGARPD